MKKYWKKAAALLALSLMMSGCSDQDELSKTPDGSKTQTESDEAQSGGEETGEKPAESTEESSSVSEKDPGDDKEGELSADAARLFEKIYGWQFFFESGAGAWDTELTVDKTGSFNGVFHDVNMGDVGEGYDDGTILICSFTGKLTDVKKVSEYVYEAKVTDLTYEREPGESDIEDNVRYLYSDAYGLNVADVVTIYLPGAKVAELPREYVEWIEPLHFGTYVYGSFYRDYPEELPFCGIYEPTEQNGFFSVNYEGKNSLYVVNKASFPGLKNVRNDVNADGTYYVKDVGELGDHEVINLCYRPEKDSVSWGPTEDLVKDVISAFCPGQSGEDIYFLDSMDADSAPQVLYLHGDATVMAGWSCGGRQYLARILTMGAYVYAYGISYGESDTLLQGDAGSFLLASLTYSGDPGRLSTAGGEHVSKKILAGIINNGADSSRIMADECIWVDASDEELMAKYHLTEEDVTNDYAIVGLDGSYKEYQLSENCPVYVQYPEEGPFWELQVRSVFHKKLTESPEPFLVWLYLDENDKVTFLCEPFRP